MDYAIYESFLDPVIMVNQAGTIQFLNSMGYRWLATDAQNNLIGTDISNIVVFSESKALDDLNELLPFENTNYHRAEYKLLQNDFSSSMHLCVCRINELGAELIYMLIIRDRVFLENLSNEDSLDTKNIRYHKRPEGLTSTIKNPIRDPSDQQLPAIAPEAVPKLVPDELSTAVDAAITIICPPLSRGSKGTVSRITETDMRVSINAIAGLRTQDPVNFEIIATHELPAFVGTGKVSKFFVDGPQQELQIQFETIGRRATAAILQLIAKKKIR